MTDRPDTVLLDQYRQEEAERQRRADEKKIKGKLTDKRELKEVQSSRRIKTLSTEEVIKRARAAGFVIETGHGGHGLQIKDPMTGEFRPLPDHGAGQKLTTGLTRDLLDFMKTFGASRRPGR